MTQDPRVRSSDALPDEVPQVIRDFRQRRRREERNPRCDFCAEELPFEHQHVLDVATRRLYCACRACYLLFVPHGAGGGRLRAVPDRIREVSNEPRAGEWAAAVCGPVQLAFAFVHSPTDTVVTCYPSPHGVTEGVLSGEITIAATLREELQPDVEAVLCRRTSVLVEVFIVPIDVCYELVGRVRIARDADECEEVLSRFFLSLRARCEVSS